MFEKRKQTKRHKVIDTEPIFEAIREIDEMWFIDWRAMSINPTRISEREKGVWDETF
jgi:hypothetical protein